MKRCVPAIVVVALLGMIVGLYIGVLIGVHLGCT